MDLWFILHKKLISGSLIKLWQHLSHGLPCTALPAKSLVGRLCKLLSVVRPLLMQPCPVSHFLHDHALLCTVHHACCCLCSTIARKASALYTRWQATLSEVQVWRELLPNHTINSGWRLCRPTLCAVGCCPGAERLQSFRLTAT